LVRFGQGLNGLDVAVVHLALGKRARALQLSFLGRELDSSRHLVVLGDFNTQMDTPHVMELRETLALKAPTLGLATYPSWQPQRALDHILVSEKLQAGTAEVLDVGYSDHCPLALEITVPGTVELKEASHSVISVESRRTL
jgi:endonuclease/exonuclease/phosphatase family metal-dependent hydrolase